MPNNQSIESLIFRQAGALADLAFGIARAPEDVAGNQNLAFLNVADLDLDLADPEQRAFGDYELLEKLGQGGMGVVYRAKQHSLNREIALKLLAAGPWSSDDFITRFQKEAQSAARLQHPNIVTVFDIGEQDDLNFFTMQLIPGRTLGEHIAATGKALVPEDAATIVRTVASAVDFAHRLGVLHLDIKPSNVLLTEQGEPMVADFGLAKQLGRSLDIENEEISGTPSYMAPEQASLGVARLSPATDVYGIGALLFECLTGRPPVEGKTVAATLERIQSQDIPFARDYNEDLPRDLDEICAKCLRRDPQERYQSARTLAQDLLNFLEKRPVSARPLSWYQRMVLWMRREPRVALASTLAFVILLMGLAATSTQWFRAEEHSFTIQNLLWDSRRDSARGLAKDGRGFEAVDLLLQNALEAEQAEGEQPSRDDLVSASLLLNAAPLLIKRKQIAPGVNAIAVSSDGEVLVTVHTDGILRWYETGSLESLGSLHLGPALGMNATGQPALVEFVDHRRVVITQESYEWLPQPYGPMVLADLSANQLVLPPGLDKDFISAMYSLDGKYAALKHGDGHPDDDRQQIWQVEPWKPVSKEAPGNPFRHINWRPLNNGKLNATVYGTMQPIALWRGLDELVGMLGRPEVYAISAWRANNAGTLLAFGDAQGRTRVIDGSTGAIRILPGIAGDSISWVSFSEDDALLVSGAEDGSVFVFDLASDGAIGGSLRHDFPVYRVEVNHQRKLVLVSGKQQSAIWRLHEPSLYPRSAVRLSADPTRLAQQVSPHVATWSPAVGLFVSAEPNGLVSFWRLPATSLSSATASRQLPERTQFDGRRVVDVQGHYVRLYDVVDSKGISEWTRLSQAPGFAELVGEMLLVSVGRSLQQYKMDTTSRKLILQNEISLRASPQRFLSSANGSQLALTFGTTSNDFFEEIIEVYDISAGELKSTLALPGPLREMRYSPQGEELVVFGTNPDRIDVFSSQDLEHKFRIFPDDGHRISAFTLMDEDILFVQYGFSDQTDTVVHWRRGSDSTTPLYQVGDIGSHAIGTVDGSPMVMGTKQDYLLQGDQSARLLERTFGDQPVPSFALSKDGSYFARASRNEVQIYNREGLPLAGVLQAEISGHDAIAKLNFSSDGKTLLARTARGKFIRWSLGTGQLQSEGLATTQARIGRWLDPQLTVESSGKQTMGAWSAESRPRLPVAERYIEGHAVPKRAATASADMLDLSDYYTMTPTTLNHEIGDTLIDMTGFPVGVQRIDGVDYDIRGYLFGLTDTESRGGDTSLKARYWGTRLSVPTHDRLMQGLHMLLYARLYTPSPVPTEYFKVAFEYADGTKAVVPIMTQIHVPGWTNDDPPVPIGWLLTTVASFFWDGFQAPISNPLILNPNPDKPVRSVVLDWNDMSELPPVIFALTAKPK